MKSAFGFQESDEQLRDVDEQADKPCSDDQPKRRAYDPSLPVYAVPKQDLPPLTDPVEPEIAHHFIPPRPVESNSPVTKAEPLTPPTATVSQPVKMTPEPAKPEILTEILESVKALGNVKDAAKEVAAENQRLKRQSEEWENKYTLSQLATVQAREELAAAREEIAALRRRLAIKDQENDNHAHDVARIENLKKEVSRRDGQIVLLEAEKKRLNDRVDTLNREIGSLRTTIENSLRRAVTSRENPSQTTEKTNPTIDETKAPIEEPSPAAVTESPMVEGETVPGTPKAEPGEIRRRKKRHKSRRPELAQASAEIPETEEIVDLPDTLANTDEFENPETGPVSAEDSETENHAPMETQDEPEQLSLF